MSGYDQWLAGYSHATVEVTCSDCDSMFLAEHETEYGATWITPEECPECHSSSVEIGAIVDPADWDPWQEYDPDRDT